MKNKLPSLLLSKWIAETIYFVGLVFIAGTALLYLLNHYLGISYEIIHLIALLAVFLYVVIGLFVSNKSDRIGISKTYFKIVISFGYLGIISYFKGLFFEYITHPYIVAAFGLLFAVSIFYLANYNKIIFKEIFKERSGINFKIKEHEPNKIKEGSLLAIQERIKTKYTNEVMVEGVSLHEEHQKVTTLFNIRLVRRLLGVSKPRLMRITLKFNIPVGK